MSNKIVDTYNPEEEDESALLNPEEVKRRRRAVVEVDEDTEIIKKAERTGTKFYNHGGRAVVEFETMGRFDIDSVMFFNDYTTQDVNDITLSRREDLLKNLIVIINRSKNEESKSNAEDMLLDEILEVLIGIKMEFNSVMHEHPWVCECQHDLDADAQVVNTAEIDLSKLQYRSIEDADNYMKEYFREKFSVVSDEQFQNYLETKYKDEPEKDLTNITRESELNSVRLEEPMGFKDDKNNMYSFRFIRVKDLIDAQKLVTHKYNSKIKAVRNRQNIQGNPLVDFKSKQEEEIEDLQHQQGKDLILYSKAFSLARYNGKTLTKDESVSIYKKIPRNLLFRINDFFENIKFGIVHEQELECPICGQFSKRLLRQEFNPFEFLPLESPSSNLKGKNARLDVFIGI